MRYFISSSKHDVQVFFEYDTLKLNFLFCAGWQEVGTERRQGWTLDPCSVTDRPKIMHFKYTSRLNSDQHNRAAFTGYVLSWVWNNESYGWWDYVEFRNEAGERGEWRRKGRSKVGKDKELIWSKGLWSYWEELPACYSAKRGPQYRKGPWEATVGGLLFKAQSSLLTYKWMLHTPLFPCLRQTLMIG